MSEEKTHFGYQTVDRDDKEARVAEVFHSVASRYDVMNDVMSFGIHRLWKNTAMTLSGARRGQKVLDLAGGTGDLTKRLSKRVGSEGLVVLLEPSPTDIPVGEKNK